MKKIAIFILFLILISCTPATKEYQETTEEAESEKEIITEKPQLVGMEQCCCELPDKVWMPLIKKDCFAGQGKCVRDELCLEKKQEAKAQKIVNIAMGKSISTGDLTERVCCLVLLPGPRGYEKAFDTTRSRCQELKGTERIWEKCYEEVCCERIGRLIVRKFLDCTKEGGKIVEMSKCK